MLGKIKCRHCGAEMFATDDVCMVCGKPKSTADRPPVEAELPATPVTERPRLSSPLRLILTRQLWCVALLGLLLWTGTGVLPLLFVTLLVLAWRTYRERRDGYGERPTTGRWGVAELVVVALLVALFVIPRTPLHDFAEERHMVSSVNQFLALTGKWLPMPGGGMIPNPSKPLRLRGARIVGHGRWGLEVEADVATAGGKKVSTATLRRLPTGEVSCTFKPELPDGADRITVR